MKDGFKGKLKGSSKQITIASCYENVSGDEALLFKGNIVNVLLYSSIITLEQIQQNVLSFPILPPPNHNILFLPLILYENNNNEDSIATSYRKYGNPIVKPLDLGAMHLSLLLSIAEWKEFFFEKSQQKNKEKLLSFDKEINPENEFKSALGELSVLTRNDQV